MSSSGRRTEPMDPNSQHQLWSRWDVTITPPARKAHHRPDDEVRVAWAKFVRKSFNTTAGEVRLERRVTVRSPRTGRVRAFSLRQVEVTQWFAQARVEGAPVTDPFYRDRQKRRLVEFWGSGFGPGTHVHIDVRIEAGDRGDGTPPAQLAILPTIATPGHGVADGERALSDLQAAAAQ